MALKLSTQQHNQLSFLELLPPKFAKWNSVIEQMSGGSVDESLVRGMIRTVDQVKAGAAQLKLNSLADAAGQMAATARRGGGAQVKVRALRDNLASVRMNFDSAMKKASTPDPHASEEEPAP